MKRLTAALVLAAALVLTACTASHIPAPSTEDPGTGEESRQTAASPPSEDSSAEESAQPAESSGIETDDPIVEIGPEQALCDEARRLLLLDKEVIDIFANCSLRYELEESIPPAGEAAAIKEDSRYASFYEIEKLLYSVYTPGSFTVESYLYSVPAHGPMPSAFRGEGGRTFVSFTYDAGYHPDVENAKISLVSDDYGFYVFEYTESSAKETLYVPAEQTGSGLRLANSLYFLREEQMQALPWTRDAETERRGSCGTLEGSCLIINVFAEDSTSSWTDADIGAVLEMQEQGLEFLTELSVSYEVDSLSFDINNVGFAVGTDAAGLETGGTYGIDAFAGTEYSGIREFTLKNSRDFYYDNVCVLFHFNKYGRSYFVPCSADFTEEDEYYYEYGVMFYSRPEDGEYFACAAVYMHELLHAFGAVDLYGDMMTERGNYLADAYFPCDIMRYVPTDIYQCNINMLTSKLIGWDEHLDGQMKALLDECSYK